VLTALSVVPICLKMIPSTDVGHKLFYIRPVCITPSSALFSEVKRQKATLYTYLQLSVIDVMGVSRHSPLKFALNPVSFDGQIGGVRH